MTKTLANCMLWKGGASREQSKTQATPSAENLTSEHNLNGNIKQNLYTNVAYVRQNSAPFLLHLRVTENASPRDKHNWMKNRRAQFVAEQNGRDQTREIQRDESKNESVKMR